MTTKQRRKIDILGVPFTLVRDSEKMPDKDDHGETVILDRKIYLNPVKNKTHDEMAATLLHEVLHAILGVSGQDKFINKKIEEGLVTALENGLYPLIKQGLFNVDKKRR